MFFILPPMVDILFLMVPIFVFRIVEAYHWKTGYGFKIEKARYRSYWEYATFAPRNMPMGYWVVLFFWIPLSFIPI